MENIDYLQKDEYKNRVKELEGGHWTKETIADRWDYHYRTIELIKASGVKDASKVLEMGTMGVSCVKGSDTIDFTKRWDFKGRNPTFIHDARITPWPIENKAYDVFVALRVFQHLVPEQPQAIKETFRIAKKVLLVIPEKYDNPVIPDSKGVSYKDFVSILGVHPNVYFTTSFGSLFFWDTDNPSNINLETVMKEIKLVKIIKQKRKAPASFKSKLKSKIKKILK
ncbi:MAG: hypothetical protein ACPG6B_06925 [Oceanihabitans sp.]